MAHISRWLVEENPNRKIWQILESLLWQLNPHPRGLKKQQRAHTATVKLILTNKEELLGEAEVTGTQGENDHVISEFIGIQERKAELGDLAVEALKYFIRDGI